MNRTPGHYHDPSGRYDFCTDPKCPRAQAPVLVATRGIPASGKTTWARAWVENDRANRARVSRDDLRSMTDDGVYVPDLTESRVSVIRLAAITALLRQHISVVCDDTNIETYRIEELRELAAVLGVSFEISDFTDVPADECARRDAARPHPVGADVVWHWAAVLEGVTERTQQ